MLSAIVLTKNEENHIEDCLQDLKPLVDEIIIVDGYSTDKTIEIASKYTDKIFYKEPTGYVEPQRKFAIEKASGDWIICLDADERLSAPTKHFLLSRKFYDEDESVSGFAFTRRNYCNKDATYYTQHAFYPDYVTRLFRKKDVMCSYKIHTNPSCSGIVKILPESCYFIHIVPNHYSWKMFKTHHMKYAKIAAMQKGNKGSVLSYGITIPIVFSYFFLETYILNKGFLDGIEGLKAALYIGGYHAMVRIFIIKNLRVGIYNNPSQL